jgi:hypothetical protein
MKLIGEKNIKLQDARYKLSANNNNETGIFIDHELAENLNLEDNSIMSFALNKANVIDALNFTRNFQMQLFLKKSIAFFDENWYSNELSLIDSHFNTTDEYKCNVSLESGNRFYLNGLLQETGFNIRNLLIEDQFNLKFYHDDLGKKIVEIITKPQLKGVRDSVFYKNSSLRTFAYEVFKRIYQEFGGGFLERNFEEKNTRIGNVNYVGLKFPKYFGNSKLLAIFDLQKVQDIKSSNSRFRYHDEPLKLFIPNKDFYFTTEFEFNRSNESHLHFDDYRRFVQDYSNGTYSITRDNNSDYLLIPFSMPIQKIFFGSPGSGKSHHIKSTYPGSWPRITFHPELDYQGFIGAYKPYMIKTAHGEQITYRFIAEAFIKAYCKAWETSEPYYLIIEEINRGNCAQIFGDIFQLLDRGIDGFSEYPILCSQDIKDYLSVNLILTQRISEYREKTGSDDFSTMSLPNNFNILCSMNTSDQSLFPMDSAFKRRWDWHYIPIDYNDANKFKIDLGNGKFYNWGRFIKDINEKIREHTQSEDKQIGNRFVSTGSFIISAEQFVNKVIFYLWSEIYKDEHLTGNSIFYVEKDREISFSDFFNGAKIDLEIAGKFIEYNESYSEIEVKNNEKVATENEGESIENG